MNSNGSNSNDRIWMIVGGDGGIGGALLNALLQERSAKGDAPNKVDTIATARRETCSTHQRLRWLTLDYDDAGGERLTAAVEDHVDHLDTLVIATGLLHGPRVAPEKNIGALTEQGMQRLFKVNAVGPMKTLARLTPLLKRSQHPKVLILSAQVGSIEDNHLGGWYSYRMAKAALNMGIKTAAIEMARWRNSPVVVALHPGTTHTRLSKPFVQRRKAPVQNVDAAAQRLLSLEESLLPSQHGSFLTLDAQQLPW